MAENDAKRKDDGALPDAKAARLEDLTAEERARRDEVEARVADPATRIVVLERELAETRTLVTKYQADAEATHFKEAAAVVLGRFLVDEMFVRPEHVVVEEAHRACEHVIRAHISDSTLQVGRAPLVLLDCVFTMGGRTFRLKATSPVNEPVEVVLKWKARSPWFDRANVHFLMPALGEPASGTTPETRTPDESGALIHAVLGSPRVRRTLAELVRTLFCASVLKTGPRKYDDETVFYHDDAAGWVLRLNHEVMFYGRVQTGGEQLLAGGLRGTPADRPPLPPSSAHA